MLREGIFLQDRYEILEPIGSGGMSVVYKARCHKLNRLVAIKVLKNEFSRDANFVSKFKMEAQAAAGLSHPNIVNVFDVVDEGELHFIVMELIEGVTLKNYIYKKGHLEVRETIGIAIQVAQGIAAAHEQRIIHRDIKPQNMIISKDGKVKVADFGIARAVSAQTLNSNAMGSVHYISPEQARGGYSDARSDIYSLGITMYEMVTGHVPFEGENTVTVALAHLEERVTPPSVYNKEIPVSLERIILKCTEKKPELRYASVNGVINDLRKALLNPNEDIVWEEPKRPLGETVMMSDEEMARIKEHKRPVERLEKPVEYGRADGGTKPPVRRPPEGVQRKARKDESVNSQIEKIMTVAGVVVAILIVAVLIFVFIQIGDILNSNSTKQSTSATSTADSTDTRPTDDTQILMPDIIGLSEDLAEAKLKESTLQINKRTYEFSDTVEAGKVISQEHKPGDIVPKWSGVGVVLSSGSDKIDLKAMNLEQLDGQAAKTLLESKKLVVTVVEQEHETIEKGKVINYDPEKAAEGGAVNLYVSTGPHITMIPVPNLTGLSEADAIARLAESGLLPGSGTTANSDTVPRGQVISQSGGTDGMIEPGGSINYVVSLGPEQRNVRYVASINTTYDMSSLFGPHYPSVTAQISIRLMQVVNGEPRYTELMPPRSMSGDTLVPVQFNSIEGAPGVESGTLEIVNVDSGEVVKTYPLTFFQMD